MLELARSVFRSEHERAQELLSAYIDEELPAREMAWLEKRSRRAGAASQRKATGLPAGAWQLDCLGAGTPEDAERWRAEVAGGRIAEARKSAGDAEGLVNGGGSKVERCGPIVR